eukprot:3646570-Pyramimonas_sp.AAC.1
MKRSGKIDELGIHDMLLECLRSEDINVLHGERGMELSNMEAKYCSVKFGSDETVELPGKAESEQDKADSLFDALDTSNWAPKAKDEHAMWIHVRKKGFHFPANGARGNPLGSRFRRKCEADPDGLGADYKACEGDTDAAAEFRAKWAAKLCTNYREGKVKKETYSKSSWKRGQYMAIGRVAHHEGGGLLGWLQATAAETLRRR